MEPKTYEGKPGLGKGELHAFGERQNALNEGLCREIERLSGELEEAHRREAKMEERLAAAEEAIAALKSEQEKNILRFGRCAAALDEAEKKIDRLSLTCRLNSNAIDRMVKKNPPGE